MCNQLYSYVDNGKAQRVHYNGETQCIGNRNVCKDWEQQELSHILGKMLKYDSCIVLKSGDFLQNHILLLFDLVNVILGYTSERAENRLQYKFENDGFQDFFKQLPNLEAI